MNFKTFIYFSLLLSFACGEENQNETFRIVGGQIVQIASVPYLVSVQYQGKHDCGGSIIAKLWILSAAHCKKDGIVTDFKIRSGSSRTTRGKLYDIEQLVPHPQYNTDNNDKDFMLIKLKVPMVFSDRQQPIILADEGENFNVNSEVLASGFGDTSNLMEQKEFLRAVVLKIIDQAKCNTAWSVSGGVTDNMLCAGTEAGGQDSCTGKSKTTKFSIKLIK